MTAPEPLERGFRLFPESASTFAGDIDAVYLALLGLNSLVMLVVIALLLTYLIRYRRASRASREGRLPLRKVHWLEWSWVAIAVGIFLVVFVWSGVVYLRVHDVPDDALEIHVVAKQWMWKFQHPGGQREIDELHVPVDRPVKLILSSQDVVHSFFVPAFRLKRDVVPGAYRQAWFEAVHAGEYRLFCAEYCGSRHSRMTGRIVVVTPAEYARWLERHDVGASLASEGAALFRSYGCSGCHSVRSRVRAPSLAGIAGKPQPLESGGFVLADEAYLRDSILLPEKHVVAGFEPVMPSFAGQITEEDLLKIIEYIQSLQPAREVEE